MVAVGQLFGYGLGAGSQPVAAGAVDRVAGVATGLLNALLGREAVASVGTDRAAMGSGANNTARYLGAAVGITLFVVIATHVGDDLAAGWNAAVLVVRRADAGRRGCRRGRGETGSCQGADSCYQQHVTTTPFHDLDDFLALPRVSGLAVSADGSRVVTTIAELNDKRTEFVRAIWELDPAGDRPARRLTRGAKGESAPVFTADNDLLFTSARATEADPPPAALWRLPAAGGEATQLLDPARRGRRRARRAGGGRHARHDHPASVGHRHR